VIHLVHHARDPRFGNVDVILDATFGSLKVTESSSPIFAAAKKAKRRIAVIQRQFGGNTYITYSPEEEEKVALDLIAGVAATLGVPLPPQPQVQNSAYERY
jgi:hypothetical protein